MLLQTGEITLSIVSHGQAALVEKLLADIDRTGASRFLKEVIITCNLQESHNFKLVSVPLTIIVNNLPKGFAANHNAAFKHCKAAYFCVLNPDVRLQTEPFEVLMENLSRQHVCMVAPAVISSQGKIEDSVRRFPKPYQLLLKVLGRSNGSYQYSQGDVAFYPHWVAGMFMLFESKAFASLHGFDEKFFLYYEDVDICARIWKKGSRLLFCPSVSVIHDGQRASHKNLKYLRWHITSMLRFFVKHLGRLPDPDRNSGII